MPTTIASTYSTGFSFTSSTQNPISVLAAGTVVTTGTAALYGNKATTWTVTNAGYLLGAKYGVQTNKGGTVTNVSGGVIAGGLDGVLIGVGTGSVANDGTIGGVGTIGSVAVTTSIGVQLKDGGNVVNGASSTTALIQGASEGVYIHVKSGNLTNGGTIVATGSVHGSTTTGIGVVIGKGGNVTNGAGNTAALISGVSYGVSITTGSSDIVNTGTITASKGTAVFRTGEGSMVNGSTAATGALIEGSKTGIVLVPSPATAAQSILNFGTIIGASVYGVRISGGGTITNGSASVTTADIYGGMDGITMNTKGSITNYGSIGGGKYAINLSSVAANIINKGSIGSAGTGIHSIGTGTISNSSGATISGGATAVSLVFSGAASLTTGVVNLGMINGGTGTGVVISGGGTVINGSASVTTADIYGGMFGITMNTKGSVANYGTIGGGKYAILLSSVAGNVVNKGSIGSAGIGIRRVGSGTVSNASNATITGSTAAVSLLFSGAATLTNVMINSGYISAGSNGTGVLMSVGGTVTNGASNDLTAKITAGYYGVQTTGTVGTVFNFGTITATHPGTPGAALPVAPGHTLLNVPHYGGYGVALQTGGLLVNGSNTDTSAYIYGTFIGVQGHGANTTMHNYGTVVGAVCGIYNWLAGLLTNGSASDTKALISGSEKGFRNTGAGQTIHNYGTFFSGHGTALNLTAGGFPLQAGDVVNGSTADTIATLSGYLYGFSSVSDGTLQNFGTVSGFGTSATGAAVIAGGTLINGSTTDTKAFITGTAMGAQVAGNYTHSGKTILNSLFNYGTITGAGIGAGVYTNGLLMNGVAGDTGALIQGGTGAGVFGHGGTVTIANDGTIISSGNYGVSLTAGNVVTNGASNATHALISGTGGVFSAGQPATVSNDGTIIGWAGYGVDLIASGTVTNGSATVQGALISGVIEAVGIVALGAAGAVVNWGSIEASGTAGIGVSLGSGGRVTNGATNDTGALISGGGTGVKLVQGGTVANYAAIVGTSMVGVSLVTGGVVINGSATDTKATINGGMSGVVLGGGTMTNSVTNDGSITGGNASGVYMVLGGKVMNGATNVTGAMITGATYGVRAIGNALTLTNDGSITASTGIGVYSRNAGVFTNGEAGVTGALISGVTYGIDAQSATVSTVTNNGTILASGGTGVFLNVGGVLTNGSTSDTTALIQGTTFGVNEQGPNTTTRTLTNFGTISGATGVYFSAQALATVVNGGTIIGTGGTALQFGVGADTLILDPGAAFQGEVNGGIVGVNVIDLNAGSTTGSIGGFGQTSGNGIENFATVTVESTANWSLTGNNSILTLSDNGTLQVANGGSLDVSVAVDSRSTGTFDIQDNATLEVAAMTGSGASIAFLGADSSSLIADAASSFGLHIGGTTYTGPLLEHFGTAASVDLLGVASAGAILNYNSTSGLLQVTDASNDKLATLAFQTSSLGAGSFHAGSDGLGNLLITHS